MKSMLKFSYLNVRENRVGYITALLVILTVLSSISVAKLSFDNNIVIFTWAMTLGLLAPLSRVGKTKLEQISYGIEHTIYTFFIINVLAFLFVIASKYAILLLALFIFICYSIPRFRKGASLIGTYLTVYSVIVWSFYSQNIFNINSLLTYIKFQSIGVSIANISSLIFISILPITAVTPADKINNYYIYVRAIRASIAITVAIIVASYFHLYNSAWICFSALVVIQQSLGASIEKAINRLLGTMLGIVLGIFLVTFTEFSTWQIASTSLIFLFFGCLFIQKNYALGLFFFTLLLVDIFYFLKPESVTIDQYMMDRFIDTFIGILIAVSCELLILPKTFLNSYRETSAGIYQDMSLFIELLMQKSFKDNLKKCIDEISKKINDLHSYTKEVRYEPLVLLSKRYKYAKRIPDLLHKISKSFDHIISNNDQLDFIDDKIVRDFFIYLEGIFNSLKISRKNTDEENLIIVHKELQQLQSFPFQSISIKAIDSIKPMAHKIEDLLNLYMKIYSTNKWYIRWK
ncbi:FUSC family protein [Legionella longbeachae]|nr:FUSC family protein [Legionella longbeachae]